MNLNDGFKNVKITTLDGKEIGQISGVTDLQVSEEYDEELKKIAKLCDQKATFKLRIKLNKAFRKLLRTIKQQYFKYPLSKKSIKKRKKHYWR